MAHWPLLLQLDITIQVQQLVGGASLLNAHSASGLGSADFRISPELTRFFKVFPVSHTISSQQKSNNGLEHRPTECVVAVLKDYDMT